MSKKMYEFIGKTINPISGKCQYECKYCYVEKMKKRFSHINKKYSGQPAIDFSAFKSYKKEELIFVGSCIDMFADNVHNVQIRFVLEHLSNFDKPQFLFQTKNPKRFNSFYIPENSILCVTIETDDEEVYKDVSKSNILQRIEDIKEYRKKQILIENILKTKTHPLHITIEPIMKFTPYFIKTLRCLMPDQVNIGADSGKNKLIEPNKDEILNIIKELEKFTKVHIKETLHRLIK